MSAKILVLEDDLTTQKTLESCLKKDGYQVTCVENGQEGLDALSKCKPDLIVSDVMMPVMDGFRFYKAVKNNPDTEKIPVLIQTSLNETEDSFLVIGVDAFFVKPLNPVEFLSTVKKLLGGQRVKSIDSSASNIPDKIPEMQNLVLLSAGPEDLMKFLKKGITGKGLETTVAESSEDIISKTAALHPKVVLIDLQLDKTPGTEVIDSLNKIKDLKTTILLYAYFFKEDLARDSSIHYFYTTNIDKIAQKSKLPVAYLGTFSKNVTQEHMIKAIAPYLSSSS